MTLSTPLQTAIHIAIADMPGPPSPRDLKTMARAALRLIEGTRETLPRFGIKAGDRTNVALAMLLASMDQARSVCFLLAIDPVNSWYSSLVLHRSQIDHFLRGAFFAQPATSKELEYFLRNNRLPSRTPQGQTKRALSINELAAITDESYGWNSEKLRNTIRNYWGPLSGIAHGGHELLGAYVTDEGIGAKADLAGLVDIVANAVALAHMVVGVAMAISPRRTEDLQDVVVPVQEAFRTFTAKHLPNSGHTRGLEPHDA